MSTEPERFFRPPTSASGMFSNWVGVFLDLSGDDEVDWGEIAAIIEEAYCLVAPKEPSRSWKPCERARPRTVGLIRRPSRVSGNCVL